MEQQAETKREEELVLLKKEKYLDRQLIVDFRESQNSLLETSPRWKNKIQMHFGDTNYPCPHFQPWMWGVRRKEMIGMTKLRSFEVEIGRISGIPKNSDKRSWKFLRGKFSITFG